MRRLILICLVILSCNFISTAQNENTSVSTSIILKNRNQNRPKKPKVPSLQYIQCIYQNGCLYFQFAIADGECQLTVNTFLTHRLMLPSMSAHSRRPISKSRLPTATNMKAGSAWNNDI